MPSQGGRKHPYQEFIQIKTDNILFICGGAFEGLDKIVSRRTGLTSSLGFKAARPTGGDEPEAIDRQRILDYMIPDDLLEFGLIPEFVGRLPVACSLDPLTQESLVRILTEPKNALTKQYQRLLHLDKVELVFDDDAIEAAAQEAMQRKTGARGLRTVIEEVLMEVMYDIPSMPKVRKCVITADCIVRKRRPLLLTGAGQEIPAAAPDQQKTA